MAFRIFGQNENDGHNYMDVNDDGSIDVQVLNSLVPLKHDQIDLTYVTSGNGAGEIETVTYKLATVTVATLTLTYDASNNLISVARS